MSKSSKRPLTIPIEIETDEQGVEWLTFVYTAKGVSTDYRIRIDVDQVEKGVLPAEFKTTNSVYPKACVERKDYKGNRWDYESSVNELGWKLCYLNDFLVEKRGLLQRAVDSYRNTKNESKSRRVARVEKSIAERGGIEDDGEEVPKRLKKKTKKKQEQEEEGSIDTAVSSVSVSALSPYATDDMKRDIFPKRSISRSLRERSVSGTSSAAASHIPEPLHNYHGPNRSHSSSPKGQDSKQRLIVETVKNSAPYQIRLRMDLETIPNQVDRNFVEANQPFPRPKTHREFLCNTVAWKLAYLNPQLLHGNLELLQRSVDVYMENFEDPFHAPRAGLRLMALTFSNPVSPLE